MTILSTSDTAARPECGCPTDGRYNGWTDKKVPKHCPLSDRPCGCDFYCALRSHARNWEEMSDILHGVPWSAPTYSTLAREVNLQFCGIMVTLRPDGTYCLSDTTGG